MSTSASHRAASQVRRKAIDISVASPQVIAHRLTRMALAGPHPSARDRKEFTGMVMEKQMAFAQSWWAAWNAALQSPWSMVWTSWQNMLTGKFPTTPWGWAEQAMAPSNAVLNAALTPISRKAVSNARRLSHTPLLVPRRKSS